MNVILRLQRRACLVSALVILVGQALSSSAETLLIDFGSSASYRGLSVPNPDPKNHYWNSIVPGLLVTDMVDFNNQPTTIDLGWLTPVGTDSYNGPAGPTETGVPADHLPNLFYDPEALGNLGVDEAVFDYAASPILPSEDTRAQFNLQGLDPAKKYNLTFFGSHSYSNDPTTVYKVFSDSGFTAIIGSANLDVQDPLSPGSHNLDKVATINDLSPNVEGILYVQFQGLTGNLGYLNDMQVVGIANTTPLTGDYNNNGRVDAADYTVWRDHLGQTFTLLNRDLANSGPISLADYTSWKNNFTGAGNGAGVLGVVPEPNAVLLAIMAIIGITRISIQRKS